MLAFMKYEAQLQAYADAIAATGTPVAGVAVHWVRGGEVVMQRFVHATSKSPRLEPRSPMSSHVDSSRTAGKRSGVCEQEQVIVYSGSWYNGYSPEERNEKFKVLKRLLKAGDVAAATGPCARTAIRRSRSSITQKPMASHSSGIHRRCTHYVETVIVTSCTSDSGPVVLNAFVAHVRRGGYAREIVKLPSIMPRFERIGWRLNADRKWRCVRASIRGQSRRGVVCTRPNGPGKSYGSRRAPTVVGACRRVASGAGETRMRRRTG